MIFFHPLYIIKQESHSVLKLLFKSCTVYFQLISINSSILLISSLHAIYMADSLSGFFYITGCQFHTLVATGNKWSCTTIHRDPIFSTRYSVICKIYTEYHGISEMEHGLCACTVDNPRAKARGLSLRTGAQTMLYLSLVEINKTDPRL